MHSRAIVLGLVMATLTGAAAWAGTRGEKVAQSRLPVVRALRLSLGLDCRSGRWVVRNPELGRAERLAYGRALNAVVSRLPAADLGRLSQILADSRRLTAGGFAAVRIEAGTQVAIVNLVRRSVTFPTLDELQTLRLDRPGSPAGRLLRGGPETAGVATGRGCQASICPPGGWARSGR
jgi:hypothetical protein